MPQVEFHTGVAEPLAFACRLLRKGFRQGARIAVGAPSERLLELDRLLWTFDERDFVPHGRVGALSRELLARTPIWLLDRAPEADAAPPVLVNLGADDLEPWPGLQRLIEVVGAHPDDAVPARARWRRYQAAGWPVLHHKSEGQGLE